jgi:hypothetical protein
LKAFLESALLNRSEKVLKRIRIRKLKDSKRIEGIKVHAVLVRGLDCGGSRGVGGPP